MSDLKVKLNWDSGSRFTGVNAGGLETVIDGDRQSGASPVELLLEALGACSAVDVVSILGKMRTPAAKLEVTLEADRHSPEPRYLTGVRMKLQSGAPTVLHWAINSVRKGGVVSVIGVYGPTAVMVPFGNIVNKGLTVRANQASVRRNMPRCFEHIQAGHINPKDVITHRFPLEDIAEGYHIFSSKLDGCVKPMLIPAGAA